MNISDNPLQSGLTEDLGQYPRDLERDRRLAAERGVDCLFVPETPAMYPTEPLVRVSPGPMAETLEGAARPGHFAAVLTVVAKLFHIVEPDVAVFGRKDFQQAMLVRRMVADLDFGLEVERSEEHTSELQSLLHIVCRLLLEKKKRPKDRKSTRLNSSRGYIS